MSSGLVQIRAIIANLAVVSALIFATSNLVTKYYLISPSSKQEANSKQHLQKFSIDDDHFIWSTDLRDWALDDLQLNGCDKLAPWPDQQLANTCLWPDQRADENCSLSDRIINQLSLSDANPTEPEKLYKISVANDYSIPKGQELFVRDKCKVNKCLITHDLEQADAIIFPNADVRVEVSSSRRSEQIWIAHLLESPPNTFDRRFPRTYRGRHTFNWTASYRSDSDIVTPYSKFVPYLSSVKSTELDKPIDSNRLNKLYEQASEKHRALIGGKETKVAWFVSNCHAKNNRLEFAQELARHIKVDIFGKCGNLTCNKWSQDECLSQINRDYKFYLAFENSNNREYITEKLYRNALGYNDPNHLLLPIVMGPPRQDYVRFAPPNSFVHVDEFDSVEDLAKFLLHLGDNSALYYSYFHWKSQGRFVDTKFMCRVCSMLHESHKSKRIKTISNLRDWWLSETTE